jgi:hypothetical protein
VLIGKELRHLLHKINSLENVFPVLWSTGEYVLLLQIAVKREFIDLLKFSSIVMLQERSRIGINLRRITIEYDLARKFAPPLVEILLFPQSWHSYDFRRDFSGRGGRPRSSLSDKDRRVGRGQIDVGTYLAPSHAEFAPTFQMGIGATHGS